MSTPRACPLCETEGGALIVQTPLWRIVRADEPGFPAFYRVIWNRHVREFSDLQPEERGGCLDAVLRVEQALRRHLRPTKVNLAALGNAVPHLHWHVIARFDWDSHFPGAVWAGALRTPEADFLQGVQRRLADVEDEIRRGFMDH